MAVWSTVHCYSWIFDLLQHGRHKQILWPLIHIVNSSHPALSLLFLPGVLPWSILGIQGQGTRDTLSASLVMHGPLRLGKGHRMSKNTEFPSDSSHLCCSNSQAHRSHRGWDSGRLFQICFIFYACMLCLHVCMCTTHVSSVHQICNWSHTWLWSTKVDAGNRPWPSARAGSYHGVIYSHLPDYECNKLYSDHVWRSKHHTTFVLLLKLKPLMNTQMNVKIHHWPLKSLECHF